MKTRDWYRHIFKTREVTKTTWKFRFVILLLMILIGAGTSGYWLPAIGECLVCQCEPPSADLIVIDNLETDYLVFERTRELIDKGLAKQVIVPVKVGGNGKDPNLVSRRFVEVMCEVAGIKSPEIVPVNHIEPFSLNVAVQVSERLNEPSPESVIVVSPLFRSRRTLLVYKEVFTPLGIRIYCVPTRQFRNSSNWWKSLHGIQNVILEFLKLQYYRFLVL